jgi:hypothetical protein
MQPKHPHSSWASQPCMSINNNIMCCASLTRVGFSRFRKKRRQQRIDCFLAKIRHFLVMMRSESSEEGVLFNCSCAARCDTRPIASVSLRPLLSLVVVYARKSTITIHDDAGGAPPPTNEWCQSLVKTTMTLASACQSSHKHLRSWESPESLINVCPFISDLCLGLQKQEGVSCGEKSKQNTMANAVV